MIEGQHKDEFQNGVNELRNAVRKWNDLTQDFRGGKGTDDKI